jgi:glycosyltransferase involved in cell wall biosynthesis
LMLPHSASKHVITVFDLSVLLFPGYHPWMRVRAFTEGIARSAARADAIIVISEHTKQDVMKLLGVPEGKIHVVLCAAAARFRPLPSMELNRVLSKYNLEAGEYLLCVGNVEPRKNLVRLVESYDLLRRSVGRLHPMVIAGGQGWHNSLIYKKVEELGLQQAVKFLGYVPDDDLPPLLNGALLFVYPSLYEGFGLPPLEAMACGTPVVASNNSSLPEVVGDAALTVDPHDVEGIAKAMEQLLNEELRNEMRTRGLARAKLFSWERTARETLKVYEEVYAKGRPA